MEKMTDVNKSFPVKYCEACERCYEVSSERNHYYKNFPTIGLERKRCPQCMPPLSETFIDDLIEEKEPEEVQ